MPYTRPVESQFVPTYAPPNIQAIAAGAQQLQQKQERGMEMTDVVGEQFGKLESQMLVQDRDLLEDIKSEYSSTLESMQETGDFIDAMPTMRSIARRLNEEVTSGKGALAISNYQTMTDNVERIRDWDAPTNIKAKVENKMIGDYKGVNQGDRVGYVNLPEYIDLQEEARKIGKELRPQTLEQIGWVRNEDGTVSPKGQEAKIRRRTLPMDRIMAVVAPQLKDNDRIMDYLTFEASLERDTPEEQEEYINRRIMNAAKNAGITYEQDDIPSITGLGGKDLQTQSSLTRGTSFGAGRLMDITTDMPDLRNGISELRELHLTGNENEFKAVRGNLMRVMTKMIENNELTHDEFQFFMNSLDENDYNIGGVRDIAKAYGQDSFIGEEPLPWEGQAQEGKEALIRDDDFRNLYHKINNWIEEKAGDVVSSSLIINDRATANEVKDMFKRYQHSPASFNIVNFDGTQKEQMDIVSDLISNLQEAPAIEFTDDDIVFAISHVNDDGERNHYMLREEIQPNQEMYENGITAYVADMIRQKDPDKAENIMDRFVLRNIPLGADTNLIDYNLPDKYIQKDLGQTYISVVPDSQSEGANLYLGRNNGEPEAYTYSDKLKSLYPAPGDDSREAKYQRFLREIEQLQEPGMLGPIFSPQELAALENAENIRNNRIPKSVVDKLNNNPLLQQPYPFMNYIEALKFNKSGQTLQNNIGR